MSRPQRLAPSEVGAIIIAAVAFIGACIAVVWAVASNPLP